MARFRAALAPRIDHWVQDGIFQLQRRAFEAQGQGCWIHLEKEIPITLDGEKLRELTVESSHIAESRRFNKRGRLRKTNTDVTEETIERCDDLMIEKNVRRPTAGTDTATLLGVDMEMGEMKKI
jgi:hypothetical protein